MICLEVIVNGEPRVVAGTAAAETVTAKLCTYPELQQTWLRVTGDVVPEGQPPADADWLSAQLLVGDQVQIRVIDSDSPTAPKLSRIEPTATATDEIPFACAFCGDSQDKPGMVASRKAMICRDCIGYLYEMTSEDAAAAGAAGE